MSTEQKNQYKLKYFGVKGRAERIRLTFAGTGSKFDEDVITFPDFHKIYADAPSTKLPWGHFPAVAVNGDEDNLFSNTVATLWYIGSQEGGDLIPKTSLGQYRALSSANTTEDRFTAHVAYAFGSFDNDELKAEKHASNKKLFTAFIERVTIFLGDNKYLSGEDNLSIADVIAFDFFDQTGALYGINEAFEKYENLVAWRKRVAEDKNIAAYLKTRK